MDATIFNNKTKDALKKIIKKATDDAGFAKDLLAATATCETADYLVLNNFFALSPEQLADLDLKDAEMTTWNELRTRTPTVTNVATLDALKYIAAEYFEGDAAQTAAAAGQTGGKPSHPSTRHKPRRKTKRSKTRRKSKSSRK